MNDIMQGVESLASNGLASSTALDMAKLSPPSLLAQQIPPELVNWVGMIAGAVGILLLGLLVATFVSGALGKLLRNTGMERTLNNMVGSSTSGLDLVKWIQAIVYWIIMILAIVAALNVFKLTAVSEPLNAFLNQIFEFLPKLGAAGALVGVAWVMATIAKAVVVRTAQSFKLDEQVSEQVDGPAPVVLSDTLGNAVYWFIFLFFLPLILGVLGLDGPLAPVQNVLNDVLSALPKLLKAVIIGVVGWFVARIVREIVTNLLAATGADQLGEKVGLGRSRGTQSFSWLLGTIVFVLILIPTATAALDALAIPAISGPATAMLNQLLSAIPLIFTAGVILAGAYLIGKFVADLVSQILEGFGFNNIFHWLGIEIAPGATAKTPSEIAGLVVLVGIILFGTVAATNVLNFPALTTIVTGLLVILGQILAGLVVFAIGLYLANLAYKVITSSGSGQAKLLGQTARIAIIALVAAMALQQMGIAPNIVNLAFGLLLGAIAVAVAIAFGLGGRDVAGVQLKEWFDAFKHK
jgi:hypothetical protein